MLDSRTRNRSVLLCMGLCRMHAFCLEMRHVAFGL